MKLEDVLNMDLIGDLSKDEIADLWRRRYQSEVSLLLLLLLLLLLSLLIIIISIIYINIYSVIIIIIIIVYIPVYGHTPYLKHL